MNKPSKGIKKPQPMPKPSKGIKLPQPIKPGKPTRPGNSIIKNETAEQKRQKQLKTMQEQTMKAKKKTNGTRKGTR